MNLSGRFTMSENIDALDQRQWHEQDNDARAAHECQLAALQADADYAEHCERQRQQDLATQMELDAMTRDASGEAGDPPGEAGGGAVRLRVRSKWTSESTVGRDPARGCSVNLKSLGYQWTPTMRIGSGCTIHLRPDELPGVIHDMHDPSRDGTRCVYGYYRKGA
jgi:hypothetical protein